MNIFIESDPLLIWSLLLSLLDKLIKIAGGLLEFTMSLTDYAVSYGHCPIDKQSNNVNNKRFSTILVFLFCHLFDYFVVYFLCILIDEKRERK